MHLKPTISQRWVNLPESGIAQRNSQNPRWDVGSFSRHFVDRIYPGFINNYALIGLSANELPLSEVIGR